MKLELTELGPVKRALKIEVPEDAVNNAFQNVYAELKRQVRVPGFRPGKAPVSLLEQRYGRAVEQDVVQRLVPDYYQRAVKEAGVTPLVVGNSTIGTNENQTQRGFHLYGDCRNQTHH